jgi:hypothetical protein
MLLDDAIIGCIIITSQTYVSNLKNKNAFTKETQEEVFKKTYDAVMTILSKDAVKYLNNAVGDLNSYIINNIQVQIKLNKITKNENE